MYQSTPQEELVLEAGKLEKLYKEFDQLTEELQFDNRHADAQVSDFGFVPEPELAFTRLEPEGLEGISEFLRSMRHLLTQFSPFVSAGLWIVQMLFRRRHFYDKIVAQVVGMLRERGITDAEAASIKEMAIKELIRLGFTQSKAEWGANKVAEILIRELPLPDEKTDKEGIVALLQRVRELASCFPGWEFEEKVYGCGVKVPLPNDRRHRVHIIPQGTDMVGSTTVEFQAVCGKVEIALMEQLLRRSGELRLGVFSIRVINKRDYFVLQHRMRLTQISQSELNRVIPYLAQEADKAEAVIRPDRDNKY